MEVEEELTLQNPESNFLVVGSQHLGDRLIVTASTAGPESQNRPHFGIAVIGIENFRVEDLAGQIPVGHAWGIVPYNDKALLLNIASYRSEPEGRRDIIVLDPENPRDLDFITLDTPSPTWGVIDKDVLYLYHNPEHNQANTDPVRTFTQYNLLNGDSESWPLPDNFDARDMLLLDEKAILGGRRGIYEVNPETRELTQLIDLPNVEKMIYVE